VDVGVPPRPQDTHHGGPAQQDQHEGHRELHGEPDPRRDDHLEEDDGPARDQDRDGVADPPQHPEQGRGPETALAADDGAHRDHVVRIGRVADTEEEPQGGDGQEREHGEWG
jgi:hypothetical protein